MKKSIYISIAVLFLFVFFASCRNSTDKTEEQTEVSEQTTAQETTMDRMPGTTTEITTTESFVFPENVSQERRHNTETLYHALDNLDEDGTLRKENLLLSTEIAEIYGIRKIVDINDSIVNVTGGFSVDLADEASERYWISFTNTGGIISIFRRVDNEEWERLFWDN